MSNYDGSLKFDTKLDDSGFSSGLDKLGKAAATGIAAIGTAVAGASAYAVKVGADFEEGMSKVQAISGATGDELASLTEKAKEMGAKTKFSATEASEAMQYMAMAGWKASDMVSGIDGIMNLAAASGEELAGVSDIVTDALTAFGLQAKDSAHFADVLAAASSNSNTNVSMMGATFKYAAPLAGALKYSVEDVATAIGLMANAGIKGEQAGTALRSMFTRLAKPPKECAEAMEALDLSITNADGSAKPLNETIQEMRTKFSNLSDTQKTQYASSIAGTEAMSGLLAIVNASDSDFEKLTEAIGSADGAAEDMAKTMGDNLKGKLTILGSSLEGVGIQAYEKFERPLKKAVDNAIKKVEGLSKEMSSGKLSGSMDKVADGLGAVADKALDLATDAIPLLINGFAFIVDHGKTIVTTAGLIAGAFAGMKLAQFISPAVEAFRNVSTAIDVYNVKLVASTLAGQTFNGTLTLSQAAVGLLTGQVTLATAATTAWNAACAALGGPIGILITAVAALGVGLVAYNLTMDDELEHYKELNEEAKARAQSFDELKEKQNELIEANLAEIDHTKRLSDELMTLVDADGKVKEGYESRASFILGELNNALGTEYSMTDGVISKYDELQGSITNLIALQRAQIILEGEKEAYTEAIKNHAAELKNLTDLEAEYTLKKAQNDAEIIQLNQEVENAMKNGNEAAVSAALLRISNLEYETSQVEQAYLTQQSLVDNHNATIARYESDAAAVKSGNVEQIEALNARYANSYVENGKTIYLELEQQVASEKANLDSLQRQRDEAIKNKDDSLARSLETDIISSQKRLDQMMLANGNELSQYGTFIQDKLSHAKELRTGLENNEAGITEDQVKEAQSQVVQTLASYGQYVNDKYEQATDLRKRLERNEEGITEDMVEAAENQAEKASTEFAEVASNVTDALGDLPEDTKTIFRNMVKPMYDEMENAKPSLWTKAKNIADGILSNLKRAFDIHSPSRKTRSIFKNVMIGAERGLDDEKEAVFKRTDSIADGLLKRLQIEPSDINGLLSDMEASAQKMQISIAKQTEKGLYTGSRAEKEKQPMRLEIIDKSRNEVKFVLEDGTEIAHWLAPHLSKELAFLK